MADARCARRVRRSHRATYEPRSLGCAPWAEDFVLARLLGDVERKRVLELGCGDGTRAVELARRGANVIAVDPSTEAGLATRKRAETAEVRIELRTGDLADLAFLRGDSVDVAFAEGSLASLSDLGRVPAPGAAGAARRRVVRVLAAAPLRRRASATEPEPDGSLPLAAPVPSTAPTSTTTCPTAPRVHPHRIGDVFALLGRVGFRVDTLLEPEPPGHRPRPRAAPRPP